MDTQYNYTPEPEQTPVFPMKWHKFLIYFSLWLSGIVSLVNAAMYFTGAHYGGSADMVYMVYGGMSLLDKVMGLLCVAMAVYAIMTRFALAGYKAKGPQMLSVVYGANAALALVYAVLASIVTGLSLGDLLDSSSITSIATGVVMIIVNNKYYTKRAVLFDKY